MLKKTMIQEIQDLKLAGYSLNEIIEHFNDKTTKGPSVPTIRKYYNLDGIPEDIGANSRRTWHLIASPSKVRLQRFSPTTPAAT